MVSAKKMKQLVGTDKTWTLVKQDVNNGTKGDEWNSLLNLLAAKMVSAKKMDQKNWIHFCSPNWKQTNLVKTWGNRLANASQDFNATQFEWFQLTTNLAEGNVYV